MLGAITAAEARALTNKIADTVVDAFVLVAEAYERRAWAVLGYESWEGYCEQEFKSLSIGKRERPAMIAALRSAGMSTRAIAAATGVSNATVSREGSGVTNVTPVTGTDGKTYPASKPRREVAEEPPSIAREFVLMIRNIMDLKSRVPFESLDGPDRIARAKELRSIRDELNAIIEQLEGNENE